MIHILGCCPKTGYIPNAKFLMQRAVEHSRRQNRIKSLLAVVGIIWEYSPPPCDTIGFQKAFKELSMEGLSIVLSLSMKTDPGNAGDHTLMRGKQAHTQISTHTHTRVYVYAHTYVYTYIHVYTCVCIYMYDTCR